MHKENSYCRIVPLGGNQVVTPFARIRHKHIQMSKVSASVISFSLSILQYLRQEDPVVVLVIRTLKAGRRRNLTSKVFVT
jgi:hypothetical protein